MILTGKQAYNAIIQYVGKYNNEVNNEEDVIKAIEDIKAKEASIIKNQYSELNAYKKMISLLDDYYNRTESDNIGAFLGEIDLIEDYVSMDPAAWEDWVNIVRQVVNRI